MGSQWIWSTNSRIEVVLFCSVSIPNRLYCITSHGSEGLIQVVEENSMRAITLLTHTSTIPA